MGSVVVGLVLVEAGTWAAFRWPRVWLGRIPPRVERTLLGFHSEFLRGAPLQLLTECYEADPELLYRPRSGTCRFHTTEFDVEVRTSGRHLREDAQIQDPEIVFLGDSVSLGWGVEIEESYPALLTRTLGLRGVVAAASSYGTVRELLLLRRLALADFRAVVIQYSDNDSRENRAFLRTGRFESSGSLTYSAWMRIAERIYEKRFLKRTRHWVSLAWSNLASPTIPEDTPVGPDEQARDLLAVVSAFEPELRGRPILLFADGLGGDIDLFLRTINEASKPAGLGTITAIDATRTLAREDRYSLDSHWRPSGHEKVAATLSPLVGRLAAIDRHPPLSAPADSAQR